MHRLSFFVVFSTSVSFGQLNNSIVESPVPFFQEVVSALSDDSLHGRSAGTNDEIIALNYIENKLQSINNRKVKFKHQQFEIVLSQDSIRRSTNSYFFINNHAKKTVLLSAHYDHIGYGDGKSVTFAVNEVHNGADDNASGVAMAMALGTVLLENKNGATCNFLIVFYSGHELGLYGSDVFAQMLWKKKRKFKQIEQVINFDMVGRMDKDLKLLKCIKNAAADTILAKADPVRSGLKLNYGDEKQLAFIDTKPFYNMGISCLNFSTGIHLDYHKPSDDAKYINYEGMEQIFQYMIELLDKNYTNPL